MKSKLAAALIVLASQPALAEEPYWDNLANGFDKMIYAQQDNAAYWNNIQSSFRNMIEHAPYNGPTAVTVALGEQDPVAVLIHARVWGNGPTPPVAGADPHHELIGSSFARAFAHEPHAGPTGVTVARQLDHRVDRLVFALSRDNKAPAMTMAAGESEKVVK